MTVFLIIAALMVAAAAGWVLWPLLSPGDARPVEHAAANVSIFKDQFADLDVDLERGTLSTDQHAEAKAELQRRLLEDVRASPTTGSDRRSHRWAAVAVALITPFATAALYWQIGTPAALRVRSVMCVLLHLGSIGPGPGSGHQPIVSRRRLDRGALQACRRPT